MESLEDARTISIKREPNEVEQLFSENVKKLRDEFVAAMDEDFNTPQAIATLFEMSKEINKFFDEQKQVSIKILEQSYDYFSELGKVLGLFQQERIKDVGSKIVDELVQLLFDLREELRKKKEYALSDQIRARMKEAGLIIEDTAEGPKWKLA